MASDVLDLYIGPDGTVTAVYDDLLTELFPAAPIETRRASHVEPGPRGGWLADMRPVFGPVLGANGSSDMLRGTMGPNVWMLDDDETELQAFPTRQAALDAERAWLDARLREGRL